MELENLNRRQLLALLAGGSAVAGGGYLLSNDPVSPETTQIGDKESRRLAEAYAPTLYYGTREKWFPTDPREFTDERDGDTVVDGFEALDGYTAATREEPYPNPVMFYNAVQYPNSSLACIQFWMYSAFDQFSTNFHWHDWEVLHVFVDRSGEPNEVASETATADSGSTSGSTVGTGVLFVASAHSRKVPNNEFLDPLVERASIISEVGSHASTLGVNAEPSTFQRTELDELTADISNDPVEVISGQASLPLAYGLPRDEGLALPYAIPEYNDAPLHEHDKLPNLRPGDLLPDDISVGSYAELASPPEEIPQREGKITFVPDVRADVRADVDARYELAHIEAVNHITDFTGPQLSFSFRVPDFVEDVFSHHLSTPGVPWEQERFTNPEADISEPLHRAALANRYDPIEASGDISRILGAVREAADTDDAPGSNGLSLLVPTVETVALLESDSEAVPSFTGVVTVENPPEGEHRLTINGAGMAPYSQQLTHKGGTTRAGVEGAVPLSPNENAVKVRGESADSSAFDTVGLDDDFAGRIYDATPPGEDGRFGIYAHRSGAYTTEVRDQNGQQGALRVNPDAEDTEIDLLAIETGKTALADYLLRFLTETHGQAGVFENGNAAGIDDVPTGQNVTDDVVGNAAWAAAENAGDLVENANEIAEQADENGQGNNTTSEGDSDDNDDDQPDGPGNGFNGMVRAVDASLLVAAAARDADTAVESDQRLTELATRLETVRSTIEASSSLPPGLERLVTKRIEQMLPRVEAALDADE